MFRKKAKFNIFNLKIFSVKIIYLAVIAIIAVTIAIIKPSTLYLDIIAVFLICVYTIFLCVKEFRNRNDRLEELSNGFDNVLKNSLNVVDIPMVIIDDNSHIVWQNNLAKHIIPIEVIHDSAIQIEKLSSQNLKTIISSVDIGNGEVYDIIGNNITINNDKVVLLSFINILLYIYLKK